MLLELQVLKEILAIQDQLDHRVPKVILELQVPKVQQVLILQ